MKRAVIRILWAVTTAVPLYLWALEIVTIERIDLHTTGALAGHLGALFMVHSMLLGGRFHFLERGVGLFRLLKFHAIAGAVSFSLIIFHGLVFFESAHGSVMLLLPGAAVILFLLTGIAMAMVTGGIMRFGEWMSFHRLLSWCFFLYAAHAFYVRPISLDDPLSIYYTVLTAAAAAIHIAMRMKQHHIRRFPHKVTEVAQIGHDTWTVRCEKNSLSFLPGQFVYLRTRMNGRVSEEHPFTISSEPTADYLEFTIKWVGDFTSAVHHLRKGDELLIDGPYGIFSFLRSPPGDIVFISGGIGITPFVSMLRYAYKVKSRHKFILLWGNKRKEDILFRNEIKELTLGLEKMKVVHVLSRDPGRRSEHGHIDEEIIKKYMEDSDSSVFFICGPKNMMRDVRKILRGMGVQRKRILYEKFGF